jgi:integrase
MGFVYRRPKSSKWWIAYGYRSATRESAETTDKGEAEKLLKLREADIVRGVPTPEPGLKRITVNKVLDAYVAYELAQGKKKRFEHEKRYQIDNVLRPLFGDMEVRHLTTVVLLEHIKERRDQGYSNATIRLPLAALNRALVLAQGPELGHIITARPKVPFPQKPKPREDFYNADEWAKLIQAMEHRRRTHAIPVMEALRLTGCRVSEIIGPQGWQWADAFGHTNTAAWSVSVKGGFV